MNTLNYKLFAPKVIICIIGPSGSGKTTIANLMAKEGIPTIVSFTTRPIRDGETNGKEHWFVKPEEIPDQSKMMAYTKFGDYEYWTTFSQFNSPICTYVIDEKGLMYLREKLGKPFVLFSFYVNRDIEKRIEDGVDEKRIERDNDRIEIPLDKYDYVLQNNIPIEELERKLALLTNALKQIFFK